MINKDDITEQDIFYYVNFPDLLPIEKREFINKNVDFFKDDIEFCNKSGDELPDSVDEKIKATFFSDKSVHIIDLYRIEPEVEEAAKEYVLAADSGVKEPRIKVDTFIDENNQFLLKVLYAGNKKKFYGYKPSGEILTDYCISIFPSKEEIHLQTDSGWLDFPSDMIIENIKIKIKS